MTLAKKACKDYRIPLLAVLIFVIMSLVNKNFFTPYNIFTIADSISGYGIVALGFTFFLPYLSVARASALWRLASRSSCWSSSSIFRSVRSSRFRPVSL